MCKLCVNYYLYICICICKLLYYNVCVCMCVLGANFLHNYFEASLAAMFFTTLSGILLLFLWKAKDFRFALIGKHINNL